MKLNDIKTKEDFNTIGDNFNNFLFNKIYENCVVLRKNYIQIYEPWWEFMFNIRTKVIGGLSNGKINF